ncbi:MAG TPA: aldo/keto reductase [Planctomycetaceae bacterium]|jgi:aryl-alcohol dehydrogenase-like predicted oxidoreductase
MDYKPLGTTGIRISAVSFGAGPVPALLTHGAGHEQQVATLRRALDVGINWFDTAPTYGEGRSEASLGKTLAALGSPDVHVATKVRITAEGLRDIRGFVRSSFDASLARLRRPGVMLLQLHNSITARRDDQPTSITPEDVLGPGGVAEAFAELRDEGWAAHLGLTGLGDVPSLFEVVRSRAFETIQVPYHVLNPSAASTFVPAGAEANYGNIIVECERLGMGVLAIRVFAGGALAGQPPSDHTRKTKFFPLLVYERDQARAAALTQWMATEPGLSGSLPKELALRFVLGHHGVSSALVGFSSPEQIDEALEYAARGPLDPELAVRLAQFIR